MGARHKLNAAYVNGALIVSLIVGLVAQSFMAGLVTAAVLIGLGIYQGTIRPTPRK